MCAAQFTFFIAFIFNVVAAVCFRPVQVDLFVKRLSRYNLLQLSSSVSLVNTINWVSEKSILEISYSGNKIKAPYFNEHKSANQQIRKRTKNDVKAGNKEVSRERENGCMRVSRVCISTNKYNVCISFNV